MCLGLVILNKRKKDLFFSDQKLKKWSIMRLHFFFQLKLNKKETIKYSGLDFFPRLYKLRILYIRDFLRDDCVRNVSEDFNNVIGVNSRRNFVLVWTKGWLQPAIQWTSSTWAAVNFKTYPTMWASYLKRDVITWHWCADTSFWHLSMEPSWTLNLIHIQGCWALSQSIILKKSSRIHV